MKIHAIIDNFSEVVEDHPRAAARLNNKLVIARDQDCEWDEQQFSFYCGPQEDDGYGPRLHDLLSCYDWMHEALRPLGMDIEIGAAENYHLVNGQGFTSESVEQTFATIKAALIAALPEGVEVADNCLA